MFYDVTLMMQLCFCVMLHLRWKVCVSLAVRGRVVFSSHESQTTFQVKIETERNPRIIDGR